MDVSLTFTDEPARLDALHRYDVLDTPPEPAFDDLAQLAAQLCDAPIAVVSLIDADRQWFKARVGVSLTETPRGIAICDHTIRGEGVLVVPDLSRDPRFDSNPLVTGPTRLRFYAGAPLVTADGHALGTICVIDLADRPNGLSDPQRDGMLALARQAMSQLELRRAAAENARLCRAARRHARKRARLAARDPLTGLLNRAAFARCVGNRITAVRQAADAPASAVLLLNLDHFGLVNDTAGREAGDQALRVIGQAIRASVRGAQLASPGVERAADVVARIGGDEFAVLLNGLTRPDDAQRVADRILRQLAATTHAVPGHHIAASIGCAAVCGRQETVEDVLREACAAVCVAKAAGRGRSVTFDARMHAAEMRRLQLERDLRAALEPDDESAVATFAAADAAIDAAATEAGLWLAYQPIVDVGSGRPVAFEALVRWRHPTFGPLSPGEFVPIAEATGLVIPLGGWVLRQAARQLAAWTAAAPRAFGGIGMNVNVARAQLVDGRLLPAVDQTLAETGLAPARLRLEITESAVMHDPGLAAATLERLRARGLPVYMDDFGTGHSSLGCLQRFRLDGLKLDRAFIATLGEGASTGHASDHGGAAASALLIVHAVLDLARCFGLSVTAEGVETEEQWRQLAALDCDRAQGYLFARPLDADAAREYVLRAAAVAVAA